MPRPISDNLAAWLPPLERKGKNVRTKELQTHVPALARALKSRATCFGIHSSVTASPSSRVPIRLRSRRETRHPSSSSVSGSSPHPRSLRNGSVSCPSTPTGKHPPLRPQEETGDPQWSGMPVIPSYPRANKPDRLGTVMRGDGILPSLVRLERAPTRHPTQNPGVGMKSLHQQKAVTKEILAGRLGGLGSRQIIVAVKSPTSFSLLLLWLPL
jgi:hypothetical protein